MIQLKWWFRPPANLARRSQCFTDSLNVRALARRVDVCYLCGLLGVIVVCVRHFPDQKRQRHQKALVDHDGHYCAGLNDGGGAKKSSVSTRGVDRGKFSPAEQPCKLKWT